ncbi:MAG: DMT family transporter [Desulfitobacteriaceae bacterium]
MSRLLLGGIRYNLAAIPLMVIIAVRKQWPNRATAFQLIKLSWFTVSGPGLFTLYGMQFLPSGFTSLIWASCPIFVIVFSLLRGEEQISWAKGFGAGLSFFGLYFLVSETMHTPEYLPLKGILSVLVAVVLFSIGIIRARVLTSIQKPVTIAAFQTFFGGLLMLLASAVFEDGRVINMTGSAYLAIIYLAIFPGSIPFGKPSSYSTFFQMAY